MNNKIVKELLKLCDKAENNGDIPISALIIKDDNIIAKAYNKKVINNDPLAHAEIIAIQKAAKKLNTYNLNDCILYCSLIPCDMCKEVIKEARIKEVYYIADNTKKVNNNTKYIKYAIDESIVNKYSEKIKKFFKKLR